jgi:hypothetical protein
MTLITSVNLSKVTNRNRSREALRSVLQRPDDGASPCGWNRSAGAAVPLLL